MWFFLVIDIHINEYMFVSTHTCLSNTSFSHSLSLTLGNCLLNVYLAERSTSVDLCSLQRYFPWGPGVSYNLTLNINKKESLSWLRNPLKLRWAPHSHQESKRSERAPRLFFREGETKRGMPPTCWWPGEQRAVPSPLTCQRWGKGPDVNLETKCCLWNWTLKMFPGQAGENV